MPQGRHIHVLLTRGHDLLTHYFPDLDDSLVAAGALLADAGDSLRSYRNGFYALQFQSGLVAAFQSRALLERAGFRLTRIVPTASPLSVIEAVQP